jgi:hypothetical protein
MGKFVTVDMAERVAKTMFENFSDTPGENFLKRELERYIPQFMSMNEDRVREFVAYQKAIYLGYEMPVIGRVIACLNPSFADSIDKILIEKSGLSVYTRASVKENGYRFQLHRGVDKVQAYTRQFTSYDLRMFPELLETFDRLPLIIGDVELVNKKFAHLAGFNRIERRIPGIRYWPKNGSDKLPDSLIESYLADRELFRDGFPLEDLELTLSFHGIFAIAEPYTWHLSREEQAKNMLTLCPLPVDYLFIDDVLDHLDDYLREHSLNGRVVKRRIIKSGSALKAFIKSSEDEGLEGICIHQTCYDKSGKRTFDAGKSVKVKKYETIDMALMGLYLKKKADGLSAENVSGALLGLFDCALGVFLPALKVNLDSSGPQVKTSGQKERLEMLKAEILCSTGDRIAENGSLYDLQDVYLMQGERVIKYLMKGKFEFDLERILAEIPRGHNLLSLLSIYWKDRGRFETLIKKPKAPEKFILNNLDFVKAIVGLDDLARIKFFDYFSRAAEIKRVSSKLVKPQIIFDLGDPLIVEARVFDIKWGLNPYPAGFHSWYGNSFLFQNAFAEKLRLDKSTVTDYGSIYDLARKNTVKKYRNNLKCNKALLTQFYINLREISTDVPL